MPVLPERREELAEVFEDYAPAVLYFFARRGFSVEDCRDLTQETFLKAYRGLARFRDESGLETWILRIAANVWKNALRSNQAEKRSAARTVSLEEVVSLSEEEFARVAPSLIEDLQLSPLSRTLRSEEYRILREAVEELPPKMRRSLLLRAEGVPYRMIAQMMRVTVDTITSQLYQARQRLRDRLDSMERPAPRS